jgi:acetyl esterase/lipase
MMVELPVRPATWFTPAPVVERTLIEYDSGRIVADIYRPSGDGPNAAMIFSMGAPPLELDDGRLVNLAEAVARGGLVMVVPFSTRLDAQRIELAEIDALVGVFEYLEEQAYVDPERIGYMGLSVGGSLALVAAADERVAERVNYVVAFGAYYNAVDALVAVGSRTATYDGKEENWEPRAHAIEVTALQLIADLADRNDRETLCRAFVDPGDRKLCGAGRDSVSSGEIARLTAEGRAAYELMTSEDPTEARKLLGGLPAATLERLERLSPSRTIERLQSELFIIHDRGDEFIPYVESRRLRDALSGRENVHFTELQLFEHVRPQLTSDGVAIVLDLARLYYRLYQLLLKLS